VTYGAYQERVRFQKYKIRTNCKYEIIKSGIAKAPHAEGFKVWSK
jgi:hypothetical protein